MDPEPETLLRKSLLQRHLHWPCFLRAKFVPLPSPRLIYSFFRPFSGQEKSSFLCIYFTVHVRPANKSHGQTPHCSLMWPSLEYVALHGSCKQDVHKRQHFKHFGNGDQNSILRNVHIIWSLIALGKQEHLLVLGGILAWASMFDAVLGSP